MILLHWYFPVARIIVSPWSFSGVLLFFLGGWIMAMANRLFRRYDTTVWPFQESDHLVVEGPYTYSRNPMYLGMLAILAGVAMLLGSLTPWAALPSMWAILNNAFIRHEEVMMEERFGDEYRRYGQLVRRWFGRRKI